MPQGSSSDFRLAEAGTSGCDSDQAPTQNRTSPLRFSLVLSAPAALVTFPAPGETEAGSAGEQPAKG